MKSVFPLISFLSTRNFLMAVFLTIAGVSTLFLSSKGLDYYALKKLENEGVSLKEAGFLNSEISLPFKVIEDFVSVETNVVRPA